MSDLNYWRLKEWLTAHEVACLACGIDPSKVGGFEQPDGWNGIYDAVIEGFIRADTEFSELYCDENFNKHTINRPLYIEDMLDAPNYATYQIKQNAIRDWFASHGIRPAYFFPEQEEDQQYPEGKYKTKMMNIIEQTINNFCGEHFYPDYKEEYPSQEIVISWLRDRFPSLSKRQAEAIEIVISPRGDNYPDS